MRWYFKLLAEPIVQSNAQIVLCFLSGELLNITEELPPEDGDPCFRAEFGSQGPEGFNVYDYPCGLQNEIAVCEIKRFNRHGPPNWQIGVF